MVLQPTICTFAKSIVIGQTNIYNNTETSTARLIDYNKMVSSELLYAVTQL